MYYGYTIEQIQEIIDGEHPDDPEYPLMSLETMIWHWGQHGRSSEAIFETLQKMLKWEQKAASHE